MYKLLFYMMAKSCKGRELPSGIPPYPFRFYEYISSFSNGWDMNIYISFHLFSYMYVLRSFLFLSLCWGALILLFCGMPITQCPISLNSPGNEPSKKKLKNEADSAIIRRFLLSIPESFHLCNTDLNAAALPVYQ